MNKKTPCPCCKSTYTAKITTRDDNDMIGPGYISWITESHNVCLDCGVYFKSQEQLKILREAAEKNTKNRSDQNNKA